MQEMGRESVSYLGGRLIIYMGRLSTMTVNSGYGTIVDRRDGTLVDTSLGITLETKYGAAINAGEGKRVLYMHYCTWDHG